MKSKELKNISYYTIYFVDLILYTIKIVVSK